MSGQGGLSYASAMAAAGAGVTVTRPGATIRVQYGRFVRVEPGFPKYLSSADDREATDWSVVSSTETGSRQEAEYPGRAESERGQPEWWEWQERNHLHISFGGGPPTIVDVPPFKAEGD